MGQEEGNEEKEGGGGNATAVAAVRLHDEGVKLAMNIRMRRSAEGHEVTVTGKSIRVLTWLRG